MNIKEAFGSETKFTDLLAENEEWTKRLFTSCGIGNLKGIRATRQGVVAPGRRYDNGWYDDTNTCIAIAEAQLGRVNIDHIQKTLDYPSFTGAQHSILICESITDEAIQIFDGYDSKILKLYLVVVSVINNEPVFQCIAANAKKGHVPKFGKGSTNIDLVDYGDGVNKASSIDSLALLTLIKSLPYVLLDAEFKEATLQRMYRIRIADIKRYGEYSTPRSIAEAMLSKLPESIFQSDKTTFLDPACGGGTFLLAIYDKLKSYGHSDNNIFQRIYGADLIVENAIITALRLGSGTNICAIDSIEDSREYHNMKFDVVIGNPPYSKQGTADKKTKDRSAQLYDKFLYKALELSDVVCFVLPSKWVSDATKTITKTIINNGLKYCYDCTSSFDIALKTCWVLLDKKYKGPCEIKPASGNVYSLNIIDTVPLYADFGYQQISKKVKTGATLGDIWSHPQDICRNDPNLHTGDIKIVEIVGPKLEPLKYTNVSEINLDKFIHYSNWKVVTNWIGGFGYIGATKIAEPMTVTSIGVVSFKADSEVEANNLNMYLNSKLVSYLVRSVKIMSANSLTVFKQIPLVDISRTWTDAELYQYFKLSEAEIQLIENNK